MIKRPLLRTWIALGFGFGLTACASSMANTQPEDPHGLIDLNARMPVGQSPYGIAYGSPSPGRVQPAAPNVDEFLKPQAKENEKLVVARAVPQRIQRDAAPAVEAAPEPVAFEPVVNLEPNQEQLLAIATEPPPPSSDDTSRYAERESQNQNLEKFRGGDALVITTGTLLVILLIVILILLLT